MSTKGLFSNVLLDITKVKLDELVNRSRRFQEKRRLLQERLDAEEDSVARLVLLVEGVRNCIEAVPEKMQRPHERWQRDLKSDLRILDKALQQAKSDPSLSAHIFGRWQKTLENHLNIQSTKLSLSNLLGELTREHLLLTDTNVSETAELDGFDLMETSEATDIHEQSETFLEVKSEWKKLAFNETPIDIAGIRALLGRIFPTDSEDRPAMKAQLQQTRESVAKHEAFFNKQGLLDVDSVAWTISSLIRSDLLTESQRALLEDFSNRKIVLKEIADVLNMRLTAIESWSWEEEIILEGKLQVSGAYKILMKEDLLQAIFLHYIGIQWSCFWKGTLSCFTSPEHWATPEPKSSSVDRARHDYFVRSTDYGGKSTNTRKRELYFERYLTADLLESTEDHRYSDDGEEEAVEPRPKRRALQTARRSGQPTRRNVSLSMKAAQKQRNAEWEELDDEPNLELKISGSSMAAEQAILHLLASETTINKYLYGEITCVRSAIEDFYPTISHSLILETLRFFGVSTRWLSFFKTFLTPAVLFSDEEGPARTRLRGMPSSHVLSEMFGAVVLFCLDFQVNQVTSGDFLWRVKNNLWFWSHDQAQVRKVWQTIQDFVLATGLTLDSKKSGSAHIVRDSPWIPSVAEPTEDDDLVPLPKGIIRWGMLTFEGATGTFEIDQNLVDEHIKLLIKRLDSPRTSIFAWIRIWNVYVGTFFAVNFGKPTNAFGRDHILNILKTYHRIETEVIQALQENGPERFTNVADYLSDQLDRRFGFAGVPRGFLHFPTKLGGLGLINSFATLSLSLKTVLTSPDLLMNQYYTEQRAWYLASRKVFNSSGNRYIGSQKFLDAERDTNEAGVVQFYSFEEFFRDPDARQNPMGLALERVLVRLMTEPQTEEISTDDRGMIKDAIAFVTGNEIEENISANVTDFKRSKTYTSWVMQLYGPEIMEKCGDLGMVFRDSLPMGVIMQIQQEDVNWQV